MNVAAISHAASSALAIAVAAMLGVATRVFLNPVFNSQRVNVTSSFSATFYDLPANLLGCFLLGLFTSLKKRLSVHPIVALSFSTGYCGSVTTFASWNYQITRMFALGDWVDSLFALYFGIALPFTIFVVGVDFSNYIISIVDSRLSSGRRQPGSVLPHNDSTPPTNGSLTTAPISDGYDPEVDLETDPDSDLRYVTSPQSVQPSGMQSQTSDGNGQQHTSPHGDRNKTLGQGRSPPEVGVRVESGRTMTKITAITLVGTLVLFCGTFSGAIVGAFNSSRRRNWASVALAPLGATLRWALATRYNRTVPNGGFPMGTFIANILATLIDFIIGAVRIHRTHSHGVEILFSATITGFAGSLSTVSTWINEAVNMTPDKRYIYLILTVAVSQVLGIVIYGSAYWVRLANR